MHIPPALIIFFIGLMPLIDRSAIPVGVTYYDMNIVAAGILFLLGNYLASLGIYYGLKHSDKWLRKHIRLVDRTLDWLFARTRTKHDKRMSELGHLALFLFICVPIPGSGGWTGALITYVFGLKPKIAFPVIGAGLAVAACIIALATEGIINLNLA